MRTDSPSGTIYKLNGDARNFRVFYNGPDPRITLGTCLVAPSGLMGRFDSLTNEARFYDGLTESLYKHGVGTLRFDQIVRPDRRRPATDAHVAARTERLRQILETQQLSRYLKKVVIFGVSLGARSLLDLLTSTMPVRPRGAILASYVMEAPAIVMVNVPWIALVFGERDHVAYVKAGQEDKVIAYPPSEYAPSSKQMLVVRPRQRRTVHFLPGVGHTLAAVTPEARRQAIEIVSKLILDMILTPAEIES